MGDVISFCSVRSTRARLGGLLRSPVLVTSASRTDMRCSRRPLRRPVTAPSGFTEGDMVRHATYQWVAPIEDILPGIMEGQDDLIFVRHPFGLIEIEAKHLRKVPLKRKDS